MMQYLQVSSGLYPSMSRAAVKKALWPYLPFVKSEAAFVDPFTKLHYRSNLFLSHKMMSGQVVGSKIALFYEARPASDGTRAVTFADGHAALILEREWPRVKRESHIP